MREHPIIFSGPMVRAILDGRKTQTRRIMKPQPEYAHKKSWERGHWAQILFERGEYKWDFVIPSPNKPGFNTSNTTNGPWRCPYGVPGDKLYVRETWHVDGPMEEARARTEDALEGLPLVFYKADQEANPNAGWQWRPSIHMPRWASRLTLEVTKIRVQRLREISEGDAKAEGVCLEVVGAVQWADHITAFSQLWDSINYKRAPWASNPFCWCISFRRIENAC